MHISGTSDASNAGKDVCICTSNYSWKLVKQEQTQFPDNRGFSWHAKNLAERKTSEEFVSKSCWACAKDDAYNFRTRLVLNLSPAISITRTQFWPADMHTIYISQFMGEDDARAKTGYRTSLTIHPDSITHTSEGAREKRYFFCLILFCLWCHAFFNILEKQKIFWGLLVQLLHFLKETTEFKNNIV